MECRRYLALEYPRGRGVWHLSCPVRWHLSNLQIPRRWLRTWWVNLWLPIPYGILTTVIIIVQGRCNHAFHMVRPRNEHFKLELDWSTLLKQHCLMTWIDLESSKGLCPMCRQSMLSLHCLCDIELTCLQNSNGRTRNNGIICGFFFFLLINGYQGVVRWIRDTPLCFYRAFKLELEELMGPQSKLSIKLMPWLGWKDVDESINTGLDPSLYFILTKQGYSYQDDYYSHVINFSSRLLWLQIV